MDYRTLGITGVVAAANWLTVAKQWRKWEVITKPAVMLLLLVWLGQNHLLAGSMTWFSLGIIFSLAGDVFLLGGDRFFIPGLVAFLLALLTYIGGFNSSLPTANPVVWLLGLGLMGIALMIYRGLSQGLRKQGAQQLQLPVAGYTLAMTLMVFSALLNFARIGWDVRHAVIAAAGALSFMASDSLLAWNKFVRSIPHAPLIVMITYQLGQVGIILGAALHFG